MSLVVGPVRVLWVFSGCKSHTTRCHGNGIGCLAGDGSGSVPVHEATSVVEEKGSGNGPLTPETDPVGLQGVHKSYQTFYGSDKVSSERFSPCTREYKKKKKNSYSPSRMSTFSPIADGPEGQGEAD